MAKIYGTHGTKNCYTKNCSLGSDTPSSPVIGNQVSRQDFLEEVKQAESLKSAAKEELSMSHGVLVVKDKFQTGKFVQSFNTRIGTNSYYDGSWEELEALVKKHRDDFEPGIGSVDNDVILVNVPPANFYTSITKITDENRHLVVTKSKARRIGEKPVTTRSLSGKKGPAKFVKVVCYRADVLARDNDRDTNAEWEIIAVLGQLDEHTPMAPETMKRNNNHDVGGTYREYSEKEWADAYAYWDTHVHISEDE